MCLFCWRGGGGGGQDLFVFVLFNKLLFAVPSWTATVVGRLAGTTAVYVTVNASTLC